MRERERVKGERKERREKSERRESSSVQKSASMAAADDTPLSLGNRKLAVLGIPWDVDTEGLKQFMSKYGELSDVIVMKDRTTGRSRGFGYVTFATSECAEKVLKSSHFLNGRMLDIKVATPKESTAHDGPSKKKGKRIFVARVPLSVTDEVFKSYFQKFGLVADVYIPRDKGAQDHRGIGFVTFEDAETVDKVMAETHEIGGATVAVDRATPKEKSKGPAESPAESPYGVFNTYLNAAARLGLLGMPPFFPTDFPGFGERGGAGAQGSGRAQQVLPLEKGPSRFSEQIDSSGYYNRSAPYNPMASLGGASKPSGKKIFVGRIPLEVTTDEIRTHFSKFGPLLDVYLPKDKEKTTHRGFAFVTFAEESSVEQVVARSHEIHGQLLAIDQAAPMGENVSGGSSVYNPSSAAVSAGVGGPGPIRVGSLMPSSTLGFSGISTSGGYDYDSPWGLYSSLSASSTKMEPRYRPY